MSTKPEEPEDLAGLYRRAFAEYGHALWNLRPVERPTPADALAITQALRTHGHLEGRRSLNASKIFAVPITKFQSDVLRSLAAHRSPDSYIAGGVAINREAHAIPPTSIFSTIPRSDLRAPPGLMQAC